MFNVYSFEKRLKHEQEVRSISSHESTRLLRRKHNRNDLALAYKHRISEFIRKTAENP